jgi:hypothetical protein
MSYHRSDEFYKEMFEGCTTKKQVEQKATRMIKGRDQTITTYEDNAVTIAQGNAATIESLINQMY